jgi:hypothetical protein
MKTPLKKIALAVLPLVALLLIVPSSALAKKKHKHCNRDSYSRYDDYSRYGWNQYDNRYGRNRNYGYYDDRYYGDDYYRRPSRSRSRYNDPYYGSPYGSPYGNPSSYYPPSNGSLPWLDLLFPRY